MEFLQVWDQHRGSFSRISPAGWSFSYGLQGRIWFLPLHSSKNGGVGEPLPETLSQMRVSRDQNLINFCFKMSICANSLWNSCNSGINIEAHSLGSQQLADHFPMRLPIEADLDPFKTQVLEHLCPRFVEHSHKSHLREHVSEHVSSICHNSPSDLHILRLSMS